MRIPHNADLDSVDPPKPTEKRPPAEVVIDSIVDSLVKDPVTRKPPFPFGKSKHTDIGAR